MQKVQGLKSQITESTCAVLQKKAALHTPPTEGEPVDVSADARLARYGADTMVVMVLRTLEPGTLTR
jgi:hypothetical protein